MAISMPNQTVTAGAEPRQQNATSSPSRHTASVRSPSISATSAGRSGRYARRRFAPSGRPCSATWRAASRLECSSSPAQLGSGGQTQLGALFVGDAGIEGRQAGLSGDRGPHRSVALKLVLGIETAVDTLSHQQAGLRMSVAMGSAGEIGGELQRREIAGATAVEGQR